MKVDRWNGYLTVSSLVLSLSSSGTISREETSMLLRPLRADLQEHGSEARVVELEVPLVVELEERRRIGVLLLQVEVVELGLLCRVAAVFADVHLCKWSSCYLCVNHFVMHLCCLTFDLLCLYSYAWEEPCTLRLWDSREHLCVNDFSQWLHL